MPRTPLVYNPGICVLAQGSKIGHLADRSFGYDADNYLVISVTIPFECETHATPDKPLLGFYVEADMPVLHELINLIDLSPEACRNMEEHYHHGIDPAPMEPEFTAAAIRLLECLQSEIETIVMGRARIREVLYRALCGKQAPTLYALASRSSHFSRIARILGSIHRNYAEKHDVNQLAGQAAMSPSAFHRAFREITSDSPMQYLKKVRLNRARDLMVQEAVTVYGAAERVGYESPSQFSREFKRYFGQSPTALLKTIR
ncbi:MAG: AraC family transcriptional regulator [Acidobacteriota bacterium]|nr:AraC family transcriptional regulator [Acidobacteriota bacterium]